MIALRSPASCLLGVGNQRDGQFIFGVSCRFASFGESCTRCLCLDFLFPVVVAAAAAAVLIAAVAVVATLPPLVVCLVFVGGVPDGDRRARRR